MWYRTAQGPNIVITQGPNIVIAQGLNIVSPVPGLPGYAPPAPPPPEQDPNLVDPAQQDPTQPPQDPNQPPPPDPTAGMARPPLHDRCHCEVITMPGGNTIWRTNGHCCDQCEQARQQWNAVSSPQDDYA